MEDLIFRYLDGECTVAEIEKVEELLSSDPDFATLFIELEQANQLLMNTPLHQAPIGFTNRVMQQIAPKLSTKLQDLFLVKLLIGALLFLSITFGLNNIPQIQEQINFSLSDYISTNLVVYSLILLFFFLVIEFFLNQRENATQ